MTSDLTELLSILVGAKVRFLIVGGHAVAKYGEPRYTKDVDLWVDAGSANAKRLYAALEDFGAPLSGITYEFFTFEDHFLKLGREPWRTVIICGMEALTFQQAWKSKKRGELYGVQVWFIGLDDLVRLKKAAGRPQDLADVSNLSRLAGRKVRSRRKGNTP